VDYELLFPGRFLRASDFKGKSVTLTISDVELEALPQDKGGDKDRGIVHFHETTKGLVINRTNASAIVAMFGRDTADWTGHKVTFKPETVKLGRESVLGIRVAGSPEIQAPVTFELKLPRKKPREVTLQPTAHAPETHVEADSGASQAEYDSAALEHEHGPKS
jgi:hypothetical protein